MRITLDIHHFVARQIAGARLQKFLQAGFRILVGIDQGQAFQFVGQPSQYPLTGSIHTGIQVNGTDQCFEGIGKDRLTAKTTAFQLPRTQTQILAQVETTGQDGQGLALDQTCAQT